MLLPLACQPVLLRSPRARAGTHGAAACRRVPRRLRVMATPQETPQAVQSAVLREVGVLGLPILGAALSEPVSVLECVCVSLISHSLSPAASHARGHLLSGQHRRHAGSGRAGRELRCVLWRGGGVTAHRTLEDRLSLFALCALTLSLCDAL